MAPKKSISTNGILVIHKTMNYIVISSEIEANKRYKCFVKFVANSYIHEALFAKPTLYVDVTRTILKDYYM